MCKQFQSEALASEALLFFKTIPHFKKKKHIGQQVVLNTFLEEGLIQFPSNHFSHQDSIIYNRKGCATDTHTNTQI